jgi:hypothetical protein
MGHDTGEKPVGGNSLVADADIARARAVLIVAEFLSIDAKIGFTTDVLGFFDVDLQGLSDEVLVDKPTMEIRLKREWRDLPNCRHRDGQ